MEMRTYIGEDEVDDKEMDEHSPGGIVHESLSNIRTVASLTLEVERSDEYDAALVAEDPILLRTNFIKGSLSGVGQYVVYPSSRRHAVAYLSNVDSSSPLQIRTNVVVGADVLVRRLLAA